MIRRIHEDFFNSIDPQATLAKGRETCRLASDPGYEIRVGDQSQNRQGTRLRHAADVPRPRRRGDRIIAVLLRCQRVPAGKHFAGYADG
jgi:hypothetical protein